MRSAKALVPLLAMLAGCDPAPPPTPEPPVATAAGETGSPAPSRSATTPPPETAALALPAQFTALGTEPFWAAKVDGERLVYSTPEDQAGQTVAITRTIHGAFVEFGGELEGKRLTLTVSAGPCSDGMSDTVYPFSVSRRLGDDEQRGCAKTD